MANTCRTGSGHPTVVVRLRTFSRIAIVLCLALGLSSHSQAADIQLKTRSHPRTTLVTLGDVAEIFARDEAELQLLSEIELFPAPAPGAGQQLTARELERLLRSRGVDLRRHTITGASSVQIVPPESAPTRTPRTTPLAARQAREVQELVIAGIARYLAEHVDSQQPWQVELTLTPQQLAAGAPARSARVLRGPRLPTAGDIAPWLGSQRMVIELDCGPQKPWFEVEASVKLPPQAVVLTQPVPKGTVIQASHVRLSPLQGAGDRTLGRLEDVVGREALRPLSAGHALQSDDLRLPILVARGEVVQVNVYCQGIAIRTSGRARDDGAEGDVIVVESLTEKKTFTARVSGHGAVEAFVQAASLAGSR